MDTSSVHLVVLKNAVNCCDPNYLVHVVDAILHYDTKYQTIELVGSWKLPKQNGIYFFKNSTKPIKRQRNSVQADSNILHFDWGGKESGTEKQVDCLRQHNVLIRHSNIGEYHGTRFDLFNYKLEENRKVKELLEPALCVVWNTKAENTQLIPLPDLNNTNIGAPISHSEKFDVAEFLTEEYQIDDADLINMIQTALPEYFSGYSIQRLLQVRDKQANRTLLHTACYWGKFETLEFLLKMASDTIRAQWIFERNEYGFTPLHIAARSKNIREEGRVQAIEILLRALTSDSQKKMLLDALNNNCDTMLSIAKARQMLSVIDCLERHGASQIDSLTVTLNVKVLPNIEPCSKRSFVEKYPKELTVRNFMKKVLPDLFGKKYGEIGTDYHISRWQLRLEDTVLNSNTELSMLQTGQFYLDLVH